MDWKKHNNHILILSSAGKPIWTRHEAPDEMASIMGVVQAIISVHLDIDDPIRSIIASNYLFVFETKGPIYLVSVSSIGENEEAVKVRLIP